MKKIFIFLLIIIILFSLIACNKEKNVDTSYPVTISGVSFLASPKRVVSLSKSVTENICTLGFANRIVGVDDFSDTPKTLISQLPKLGTSSLPKIDEILSLSPDFVVSSVELPKELVSKLNEQQIPYLVIPYVSSLEEILNNYKALSYIFNGSVKGELVNEDLEYCINTLLDYVNNGIEKGSKAAFVFELPNVCATSDTWINDLFDWVGLENSCQGSNWILDSNYTPEADIIFCNDKYTLNELSNSIFKDTAAVVNQEIVFIDSNFFECESPKAFFIFKDSIKELSIGCNLGEEPSYSLPREVPIVEESILDKIKNYF